MIFKRWCHEKAALLGISLPALKMRLSRGTIPYPHVIRVNPRVIEVVVEPVTNFSLPDSDK